MTKNWTCHLCALNSRFIKLRQSHNRASESVKLASAWRVTNWIIIIIIRFLSFSRTDRQTHTDEQTRLKQYLQCTVRIRFLIDIYNDVIVVTSLTLFLSGLFAHRLYADVIARLQCRVMVEEIRDERQVEFLVSADDVARRHETTTSQFLCILQHQLCTRDEVRLLRQHHTHSIQYRVAAWCSG